MLNTIKTEPKIKLRSTVKSLPENINSWTLTGREATFPNDMHAFIEVICKCGFIAWKDKFNILYGKSKQCKNCAGASIGRAQAKRPYEAVYNAMVHVNRKRFPIKFSYKFFVRFIQSNPNCHYCNSPLYWRMVTGAKGAKTNPYNIDRMDNRLGYSTKNICACCPSCNAKKGSAWSYIEFRDVMNSLLSLKS